MQNKTKELILMIISTIGCASFILIINDLFILGLFFFLWLSLIIEIKSRYRGYKNNIYFLAYLLFIIAFTVTFLSLMVGRNDFGLTIDNLWGLILCLVFSARFIIEFKNRNDRDYKNEWKI